jgi:hypothetical protein
MREDDQPRMTRIVPLLEELVGDESPPRVCVVSWGTLALLFSTSLWIDRGEVDGASDSELRGLLAHELAHLRDPYRWREQLAATALIAVPVATAPVFLVASQQSETAGSGLWFIAAVAVICVWYIAARLWARRSRRCEYRADALAMKIASPDDVAAMLRRLERRERTRSWILDLADRLLPTHPPVQQRLAAVRSVQQPRDVRSVDPTDDQVKWAAELAEGLLKPLGSRWRHTLGVVERARRVTGLLDQHDARVLVAAAYLHDIGYAPAIRDTMFHPLDGARFLRDHGCERLAKLVAHHTGARVEAEELGLEAELAEFPEERSLVAKLLSYCDLTTSPDGHYVEASARLEEIILRYGDAPPARAARRSAPVLLAYVREVESVLSRGVPAQKEATSGTT